MLIQDDCWCEVEALGKITCLEGRPGASNVVIARKDSLITDTRML